MDKDELIRLIDEDEGVQSAVIALISRDAQTGRLRQLLRETMAEPVDGKALARAVLPHVAESLRTGRLRQIVAETSTPEDRRPGWVRRG